MSWFDTSGLASIAKSALKEAQKTIDKALDIKDEGFGIAATGSPVVDTNSDDFFGTWGIPTAAVSNTATATREPSVISSPTKAKPVAQSLWGSFTGSFFEAPKENESLDDSIDLGAEHFNESKLVVQHSEEGDGEVKVDTVGGCREEQAKRPSNRLSIVSNGSGKNSSESVEILSGGTTSPDTDALSVGLTPSSSSSPQGFKQASESVEVLPDSLMSPSSLEVLGSDSSSSLKLTGDFVSPLESPESLCADAEKHSISSVDVVSEDPDENSIAEDTSYTSVSETTSTTILETVCQSRPSSLLKETLTRQESLKDANQSPEKASNVLEPITRAPSRSAMVLPLNPMLIDTQPLGCAQDLSSLVRNDNVIDIPQIKEVDSFSSSLSESQSNDEGSQSDRTLIGESAMESSSDNSTLDGVCNSTYLRNMLAEAMAEKPGEIEAPKVTHFLDLTQSMIDSNQIKSDTLLENISISQLEMPPRENSPISSESRSDLVKIGSDHTSGHTSADEIETTTSSDIEIISSPNGDSSSTQSRQSPAKQASHSAKPETNVDVLLSKMTFKNIKGHNRELSEASSMSDDSHSAEIDRLIKRLSEMTDILEIREARLVEVNRRNAELQEVNCELKKQLDGFVVKQSASADVSLVTEEYTQRLSALEKKFQQTIREKDLMRKQLEQYKQDASQRISKSEMESLVREKEEVIKELREEGEKLSKQQLQHSNIIKKLRAKEKDQEAAIKHLRERVEELTVETERLNRSLSAKDDVERSQIEAIHQLTSKNKKLEKDFMQLQSQYDDLTERFETVKKSNEAAKKELAEKTRASSELTSLEQTVATLEAERSNIDAQREQILCEMEDLRQKLRDANQEYLNKEQNLKFENSELLRRLEDAERRNEELAQQVLEVSRPLMRQLESLQSTYNSKVTNFEKIEQNQCLKINELETRLKTVLDNERLMKDEFVDLRSKMSDLEYNFSKVLRENDMLKVDLDKAATEKMISEQELKREISNLQEQLKSEMNKTDALNDEIISLQNQLLAECSKVQKQTSLQESHRSEELQADPKTPPTTRTTSPTLSLERASLSESLSSTFWSHDETELATAPRYTNMFELQILQSNLKQKEGEVQQLQWELNRREHERTLLNGEISTLLRRVESLEAKVADHEKLTKQHSELQQQYDTLCQLYGEKVEENEELKLDLLDVKDMFKQQIDELLRQRNEES